LGKKRLCQLKTVSYHCGHRFKSEPEQVIAAPEKDSHLFSYHATCSECSQAADQAAWEQNLMIAHAHAHATGPVTDEGIRRWMINILERGADLGARHASNFVGLAWRDGELVVNQGPDCYFTMPDKPCPYHNLTLPASMSSRAISSRMCRNR
jgi:hypothetical protein